MAWCPGCGENVAAGRAALKGEALAIGVDTQGKTRERLLAGAGAVFASAGYHGATVREICRRSGCNVAAVNYHFGNKKQLYAAVIRHTCERAFGGPRLLCGICREGPAEDRLRSVVHTLLAGLFDESRPAWHDRLLAREILEPTEALESIILDAFRPLQEQLAAIVGELLGPGPAQQRVSPCVSSVFGQCMHLFHARALLTRVSSQADSTAENVERWTDHIVRFSLAGIERIREDGAAA